MEQLYRPFKNFRLIMTLSIQQLLLVSLLVDNAQAQRTAAEQFLTRQATVSAASTNPKRVFATLNRSSTPRLASGKNLFAFSNQQASGKNTPVDVTITGIVTDEVGAGLPGVSVIIKGTQRGTNTNTEGRFSLNVPDKGTVLVFHLLVINHRKFLLVARPR